MKLAEALIIKADLSQKFQSLKARLVSNILVQEGNQPSEDPEQLQSEAVVILGKIERLKAKIEIIKAIIQPDGRSLNDLLAQRDTLTLHVKLLKDALGTIHRTMGSYYAIEIKWLPTISVTKLEKQIDELLTQLRELNLHIQELNLKLEID